MKPGKLVEQNTLIKKEADVILYEKKLLAILSKFGNPHISGSYILDLMTWRDLDIYLQTPLISEEKFFELGAELCTTLKPSRMRFRNERITKTEKLPDGLYWGIYLDYEWNGGWKIDVWAVDAKECERLINYANAIKQKLNEDSSHMILSIKSQCCHDPQYRHIYTSSDIYDAVLGNGVRDLEGFWNYLDK